MLRQIVSHLPYHFFCSCKVAFVETSYLCSCLIVASASPMSVPLSNFCSSSLVFRKSVNWAGSRLLPLKMCGCLSSGCACTINSLGCSVGEWRRTLIIISISWLDGSIVVLTTNKWQRRLSFIRRRGIHLPLSPNFMRQCWKSQTTFPFQFGQLHQEPDHPYPV